MYATRPAVVFRNERFAAVSFTREEELTDRFFITGDSREEDERRTNDENSPALQESGIAISDRIRRVPRRDL
jgi:hypothetical protein